MRSRALLVTLMTVCTGVVLTLLGVGPASATFAGGNGAIAFVRNGNVWTADAGGSGQHRLTRNGGFSTPTWSPDGQLLAYRNGGRIVVRDVATGERLIVAKRAASAPSWSPDGSSIAFVRVLDDAPCGEQAVFAVAADGSDKPRLVFNPFSDNCPHGTDVFGLGTYTPGGGSLVLTTCYRYRDDTCTLSEVSADPAQRSVRSVVAIRCDEEDTPVDGNPGSCDFGLHLSAGDVGPFGNGVLFSGKGGNPPLPGTSSFPEGTLEKVYAVDKSGSGLHRVSTAPNGQDPVWSPNGSYVLFTQQSGSTSNIVRVQGTSAGATPTVLIRNASQADWQPVR